MGTSDVFASQGTRGEASARVTCTNSSGACIGGFKTAHAPNSAALTIHAARTCFHSDAGARAAG